MSFVNLLDNTLWSDADITRRTEEIIHGQFSVEAEGIINRKATGAALGQYTMTPDEVAELTRYAQVCESARQEGIQARADMDLLRDTLAYEQAMRRLVEPLVQPVMDEDGNVTNGDAIDADADERDIAQAVVDIASQAVVDLYTLRNPPEPEPEPEPEPVPEVVE